MAVSLETNVEGAATGKGGGRGNKGERGEGRDSEIWACL